MAARSKIADMVKAEADAAEAENPDDGEDETNENPDDGEDENEAGHEAEADEAEAQPELSAEAFAAKLETILQLHSDNMRGLFADAYDDMDACPLCNMFGVVSADSPVLDPTTTRCDRCHGYGELLTESVHPQHERRQCPDCLGNGYVPKPVAPLPQFTVTQGQEFVQPQQTYGTPNLPPAPVPPAIPPMPVYDPVQNVWKDPQGNVIGNGAQAGVAPAVVP